MKTHVKKGDEVIVITGKNKGQKGKVLTVNAAKGRVSVEGVATIKKAVKPSDKNPDGGIVTQEGTIHISNVKKVG